LQQEFGKKPLSKVKKQEINAAMEEVLAFMKEKFDEQSTEFTEKDVKKLAKNYFTDQRLIEAIGANAFGFVKGGNFTTRNNSFYFIPTITVKLKAPVLEQESSKKVISMFFEKFLQVAQTIFQRITKKKDVQQVIQKTLPEQLIVSQLASEQEKEIKSFMATLEEARKEGIITSKGIQKAIESLREVPDLVLPPKKKSLNLVISNVLENLLNYNYSINVKNSVTEAINVALNVYFANPNLDSEDPGLDAAIEKGLEGAIEEIVLGKKPVPETPTLPVAAPQDLPTSPIISPLPLPDLE